MDDENALAAFAALAQPSRLAIYRLLLRHGPQGLAAGAVAEALGLPAATLSFHLAQLHRAGLLRQRRESRALIYSADTARMSAVIGFLTEQCCAGQPEHCFPAAASSCLPTSKEKVA